MTHDNTQSCDGQSDDTTGMMGQGHWVWSHCSALVMQKNLAAGEFSCLKEINVSEFPSASLVNTSHTFSSLLPGQMYSKDEACRMFAGKAATFYDSERDSCNNLQCAVEKNGVRYLIKAFQFLPGSYCGDGKICFRTTKDTDCHDLPGTGIAHKETQQGGWSRFGPWSPCTNSDGPGVTFRKRECSNPVPMNAPYCEGSQYDYALCNTEMDPFEAVDIAMLRQDLCGAVGEEVKSRGHAGCEVACTDSRVLLPDGAPCDEDVEGSYCIQGYCKTVTSKFVQQTITGKNPGGFGNREDLVIIPAGSSSVDIWFPVQEPAGSYTFEIWSKDGTPIIRPFGLRLTETGRNPINFAGTYWGYSQYVVELFSETGFTLLEPADIKLKQRTNEPFSRNVIVTYIQPLSDTNGNCVRTCGDHGTWNSDICSCDCDRDFYGPTCESTCRGYCFNGYNHDSSCNCDCDIGRTNEPDCQCRAEFTGKDCTECTNPALSPASGCVES